MWGTIGIAIIGSFLIGCVAALTPAHAPHSMTETALFVVMAGSCGGFATFSSFSLQSLDLLRGDAWLRALRDIGLLVPLSRAAVPVGHLLAAQLIGGAVVATRIPIEEEA